MGTSLANRRSRPLVSYHRWDVGNVYPNELKGTASTDLSLDEARVLYQRFAVQPLSTSILHPRRDDALRAMVTIASMAKQKQAGWGRLRLEALRQLGLFLIRYGKGQGRPAKTSADDVLQTLAGLGITDRHISADAKNVAHGSAPKISTLISPQKTSRPSKDCCGLLAGSPTGQRWRML